jgi:predicted transport protein
MGGRAMSDIKLFRVSGGGAMEVQGESVTVERSLQTVIERDCEVFLGVTFLASEYATGKTHGGRIDTLGIDEDDCPVIVEYKRATNENVINQGLFYLDWLLDHKAEFKLLVLERLDKQRAEDIDWSSPRLLCIAGDFTRYDKHAVQQINRNIDLFRYQKFGSDLIALQLVHRTSNVVISDGESRDTREASRPARRGTDKPVEQVIEDAEQGIKDLFVAVRTFIIALGDDVQEKQLKLYMAYRRIKNFASVVVQKRALVIYLKLDPTSIRLEEGFTRDVREIGHWGTGNLEVTVSTNGDLLKAQPLISRSYEGS